jgi:paraquat-inducible protein A
MSEHMTARMAGLALCRSCHKTSRINRESRRTNMLCPRCGSVLHSRVPDCVSRTWALVITAFILLIPANVYPVMTVIYLGKGAPDTIISGVIQLVEAGMYPIAALVFVASIAVPVMKLIGISILLLIVQRKWKIDRQQCTVMYRFIALIGRWSMLDLFMISIMVTLVELGAIATITAGFGATAFASVVVVTIFAANSFDPRLIWDMEEVKNG